MPFKSEAQRKFLFSQHPKIAKEFAAATPKGKKLPARVRLKKTIKSKSSRRKSTKR